jgi:hypothetical protein
VDANRPFFPGRYAARCRDPEHVAGPESDVPSGKSTGAGRSPDQIVMRARVTFPILLALTAVASAQISVDEAQRRLNARLATRPASTQPISEVERLRIENRKLREENLVLTAEVTQLRDALAGAASNGPTTGPTTLPTPLLSGAATKIVGHWSGGELSDGTAFVTDFSDDGTYKQSWLTSAHHEEGHWQLVSDDTLEMWTNETGDDQAKNRWHVDISSTQLTLRPLARDGSEITAARPLVLRHTP